MRLLPALSVFALLSTPALAQEPLRIGLSVPLSGPYKMLGEQARAGAQAAVTALAGTRTVELVVVDDACTAEGGTAAAARFAGGKVQAVAGFLCTAPLTAAGGALSGSGLPLVTVGVRTDAATKTSGTAIASVFRMAPSSAQESDAVSKLLLPLWRGKKFAIVDDGTLRSRELAESLRGAAEEAGLKPALIDTLRPGQEDQFALVSRLKKAGITHAFISGDREDVSIIAQNAADKGYKLTAAGSDVLNAAPLDHALPDGVLMIGVPPADRRQEAQKAAAAASASKLVPEGYFLPAYAAIEVIAGASAVAANGNPLNQAIQETAHQTVIGPVRFAPNGDLMDNPCSVLVSRAGAFEIYQQ
jgi:branched-chain amino acid transport system substrate-binding protein